MKPLLEVSDVCLSYHSISGETRVLSHISFSLFPGEFLAVVGPLRLWKIHSSKPDMRITEA